MAMKQTYTLVLPYLHHLDRHPAFPVPSSIRTALKEVVKAMAGLPGDTVVSKWVERQLRSGV